MVLCVSVCDACHWRACFYLVHILLTKTVTVSVPPAVCLDEYIILWTIFSRTLCSFNSDKRWCGSFNLTRNLPIFASLLLIALFLSRSSYRLMHTLTGAHSLVVGALNEREVFASTTRWCSTLQLLYWQSPIATKFVKNTHVLIRASLDACHVVDKRQRPRRQKSVEDKKKVLLRSRQNAKRAFHLNGENIK